MTFFIRTSIAVIALAALGGTSNPLLAQACHGLPRKGGIAYEHGKTSVGDAPGASLGLAGRRLAFGLNFRMPDYGDGIDAIGGGGRFALLFGAGKALICPGIGVDYENREYEVSGATVTRHIGSVRAGVSAGAEFPVGSGGLSLIPFGGIFYQFDAIAFDLEVGDAENEVTGDTLSHAAIEAGLVARFRFLYAGYALNGFTDEDAARMSRIIVGVTWGSGGSSKYRPSRLERRIYARR